MYVKESWIYGNQYGKYYFGDVGGGNCKILIRPTLSCILKYNDK